MFSSEHLQRKFLLLPVLVLVVMTVFLTTCCASFRQTSEAGPVVVDSMDSLDFYGEWVMSAHFGRVWRPYVVHGWRPYRFGRWGWTEYGWTWLSYEPFGWMVYHYGHWYHDPRHGWVWLPGQIWFPANVMWIHFDTYIGWAPMPPPGIIVGDPWAPDYAFFWTFVDIHHFASDRIYDHVLPRVQKQKTVIRQAPEVDYVQKMSGVRVEKIPITPQREQIQEKKLQKMELPPAERKKVERKTAELEKKILKPKQQAKPPQKEKKKKTKE